MCHNINGKRDFLSIFNVCSKYCAAVWCGHILLLALFWEFRTFWPTLGSFRRIKPVFYMLFFASERRFGKCPEVFAEIAVADGFFSTKNDFADLFFYFG